MSENMHPAWARRRLFRFEGKWTLEDEGGGLWKLFGKEIMLLKV
jgi:hypothetical protein